MDKPTITRALLRQFGVLMGVFLVSIFGIVMPWLRGHALPMWPWAIATIFWSVAAIAPSALRPVYDVWMKVGAVLGYVNTSIILGLVFYGIITPMGIIMRLFRYDPMAMTFKSASHTYRCERSPTVHPADMEKPY